MRSSREVGHVGEDTLVNLARRYAQVDERDVGGLLKDLAALQDIDPASSTLGSPPRGQGRPKCSDAIQTERRGSITDWPIYDAPMLSRTSGHDAADIEAVPCSSDSTLAGTTRIRSTIERAYERVVGQLGVDFRVTSMSRLPKTLGLLRHVQDAGYLLKLRRVGRFLESALDGVGGVLEGEVRLPSPHFDPGTGQYLVTHGDRISKVCVDAVDYPELSSPELAEWSDLYFKTNWWPSVRYPGNVRPLVNGDPMVLDRIALLRAARSTPKTYDICCIVRVWGGRDTVEGIEHNLRLLRRCDEPPHAASCWPCSSSAIEVRMRSGWKTRWRFLDDTIRLRV